MIRLILPFCVFFQCVLAVAAVPFEQALNDIIGRNPAISIQQFNVDLAKAKALPVKVYYTPTISGVVSETSAQNSFYFNGETRKAELNASLNLFKFGADSAALGAANADIQSQNHLLDAQILKTEESGVRALIGEIQRKMEIEVSQKIVKSQEELLKIARERYKRGLLPAQEAEKVAVDLSNASAGLTDAKINENDANALLVNLLGHANIEISWPWREQMVAHQQKKANELISEKFEFSARPDWQASKSATEAEAERLDRSWRLMLPSLDASFAYGYYFFANPYSSNTGWTGTLALNIPIFDQLTKYSNYRAQVSTKAIAEQNQTQVERDSLAQWESSRKDFEAALGSAISRDQTLALSRRLYMDNLMRFRNGRISANDLVVDQKRLYDSELFAIQGWATVHVTLTQLCHSLGRRVSKCI